VPAGALEPVARFADPPPVPPVAPPVIEEAAAATARIREKRNRTVRRERQNRVPNRNLI